MLRMFVRAHAPGGSAAYWEENWASTSLDEPARAVALHPLRETLERFVGRGTALLEGGCGPGHFARFFHHTGLASVIGLDFAVGTLGRIRAQEAKLPLIAGDVAALPLAAESVDVYYSGGVVEHFALGPHEALREARRVLRPGGVLLITVPDQNVVRRLEAVAGSAGRHLNPFGYYERVSEFAPAPDRDGWRFFQYVFEEREFAAYLTDAGFRVERTLPHEVLWGLCDLRLAYALCRRLQPTAPVSTDHPEQASREETDRGTDLRASLKRLLIEEKPGPLGAWLLHGLRLLCPNLRLYVCRR